MEQQNDFVQDWLTELDTTAQNIADKDPKNPHTYTLKQISETIEEKFQEESRYLKDTPIPKPITSFEHIAQIADEFVDYLMTTDIYDKNTDSEKQRYILSNKEYFPTQPLPSMETVDKELLKQCFINNNSYANIPGETSLRLQQIDEIVNGHILKTTLGEFIGCDNPPRAFIRWDNPPRAFIGWDEPPRTFTENPNAFREAVVLLANSRTLGRGVETRPYQVLPGEYNRSMAASMLYRARNPVRYDLRNLLYRTRLYRSSGAQSTSHNNSRSVHIGYLDLNKSFTYRTQNTTLPGENPKKYLISMLNSLDSSAHLDRDKLRNWGVQNLPNQYREAATTLSETLQDYLYPDSDSEIYANFTNEKDGLSKFIKDLIDSFVYTRLLSRVTNNALAKYLDILKEETYLQSDYVETFFLKQEIFISLVQEMTLLPVNDEFYRKIYRVCPEDTLLDLIRSSYTTTLAEDIRFMHQYLIIDNEMHKIDLKQPLPEDDVSTKLISGYLRGKDPGHFKRIVQNGNLPQLHTHQKMVATQNLLGKSMEVHNWILQEVHIAATQKNQTQQVQQVQQDTHTWIDNFLEDYEQCKNRADKDKTSGKVPSPVNLDETGNLMMSVPIKAVDPEYQVTKIKTLHITPSKKIINDPKLSMFPRHAIILEASKGTGYKIPILPFWDEVDICHYLVPSTQKMANVLLKMYREEMNPVLATGGTYVQLLKYVLSSSEAAAKQLTTFLQYRVNNTTLNHGLISKIPSSFDSVVSTVLMSEHPKVSKDDITSILRTYSSMLSLSQMTPAVIVSNGVLITNEPQKLTYIGRVNLAKFLNVESTNETDIDSNYLFYNLI